MTITNEHLLYPTQELPVHLRQVHALPSGLHPGFEHIEVVGRTRDGGVNVIDSYRQLLGFDLALIEARTQKELALASLSLLIAGVPPQGSPTLAPNERSDRGDSKEDSK
ncbi:MAG: hypothetical protein RDV41_11275 [Planctomycetota bacterium]|nr:hypothetical protein [Planctomycetota bacterium]